MGRMKYPDHMKAVTTSLRLRPDRLAMFKDLGGTKWINTELDKQIKRVKRNATQMA
jgi:hypothetical protein